MSNNELIRLVIFCDEFSLPSYRNNGLREMNAFGNEPLASKWLGVYLLNAKTAAVVFAIAVR